MKKIIGLGITFILLVYLIVSLGFVESRHRDIRCNKVSIIIRDSKQKHFIDKEDIFSIITNNNIKLIGSLYDSLNMTVLENLFYNHPIIKEADIYQMVGGEIVIEIEQRTPIIRIVGENKSYYFDEEGVKLPVSDKYTSRVLVANGHISEDFGREEILPIAKSIWKNKFWNSQIEQIWVDNNKEIELITRVGDFTILFGDASRPELKLNKLEAMYRYAFNKVGWDIYKSIDLRYSNQVVCTKK